MGNKTRPLRPERARAAGVFYRHAPQHGDDAGENECGPGESRAHCAARRHSSLIMATPAMSMPTPLRRSVDTGRIGRRNAPELSFAGRLPTRHPPGHCRAGFGRFRAEAPNGR